MALWVKTHNSSGRKSTYTHVSLGKLPKFTAVIYGSSIQGAEAWTFICATTRDLPVSQLHGSLLCKKLWEFYSFTVNAYSSSRLFLVHCPYKRTFKSVLNWANLLQSWTEHTFSVERGCLEGQVASLFGWEIENMRKNLIRLFSLYFCSLKQHSSAAATNLRHKNYTCSRAR